mmetsp:Transcript_5364/g.6557  ORF Transcript_5364/g.6557 Transcript_5364/m.6557 type:complete len:477 (+) Transcript_5364:26-1456(+)
MMRISSVSYAYGLLLCLHRVGGIYIPRAHALGQRVAFVPNRKNINTHSVRSGTVHSRTKSTDLHMMDAGRLATPTASTAGCVRSLASEYIIDISSEWSGTGATSFIPSQLWKLRRIVATGEGVGTDAIRALGGVSPADEGDVTIKASVTKQDIEITVSCASTTVDPELVDLLSRIAAQRMVHTLSTSTSTSTNLGTVRIGTEEIRVSDMQDPRHVYTPMSSKNTGTSELVEMVDGSGTPLAMVPRELVHRFNLLHRGIGVMVFDNTNQNNKGADGDGDGGGIPRVYVHRRTDHKRVFPSLYDMFVGGVSGAGESAEITARRELAEELGLLRVLRTTNGSDDETNPLSEMLFRCTVCTSYNRCVVSMFAYTMDNHRDVISWQKEEVAWGTFVPYPIVQQAARLSIDRLKARNAWPGDDFSDDPHVDGLIDTDEGTDWKDWDFVPDGLLVWEAWEQWRRQNKQTFADAIIFDGASAGK